jgi:urea transporter
MSERIAKHRSDVVEFLRSTLRGVGQIVFQGHAGTGLFFLVGIGFTSRVLLLGALLGALVSITTARLLHYDEQEISQGLFGFNSTLVGIAIPFYLNPASWITWMVIVVGAVLATLLTRLMRQHLSFPSYTAPFILTTWVLLLVVHAIAGTGIDYKPEPPGSPRAPNGFVSALLAGEAEIMFGSTTFTGLMFLLGIALSSRTYALLTLLGTVVGTGLAYYHNDPANTIRLGIYGYNAALAAAGIFLWRESILLAILAAVVSVPLTEFFPKALGIPALTAPFVAACWLVIAIGSLDERRSRHVAEPRHA